MKTHVAILCATTLVGLTILPLDAARVSAPSLRSAEIHRDEASADFNSTVGDSSEDDHLVPIPRQEEEERPYENVPRVLHSIRKIVKGVLKANIHDIFHGAFSFAPREVSNNMIEVYNQVVGLPDRLLKRRNRNNGTQQDLSEEFDEEEE